MNKAVRTEPVDILLVEDQPYDAELAERALRERDLDRHLLIVRDGSAALDFLFGKGDFEGRDVTERPRIILLDLKLPRVNGIDVLQRLKTDKRTRDIPVVVLSSSKECSDIHKCYRLGANSYVVKPIDYIQFTTTVQRVAAYWLSINESPF